MPIAGKRVLITGGARGLGLSIAERFSVLGAQVLLADIDLAAASDAAAGMQNTLPFEVDLGRKQSIDKLYGSIEDSAGGVDILVNNAGVFDISSVAEATEYHYERLMGINVKGTFFMLQGAARKMIQQGTGGKIINISSQAGRRGEAIQSVYCASKAAINSLTQSAAVELIPRGINVNGVAPGAVDTPMWSTVDAAYSRYNGTQPGKLRETIGKRIPFGRIGVPQDHVGMVVFLASEDASYVVGQTFSVDGGMSLI